MTQVFRLELDQTDIAFINDAAVQLPFFRAAPFIDKINKQIQESLRRDQEAQEAAPSAQKLNAQIQESLLKDQENLAKAETPAEIPPADTPTLTELG